MSEIEAAFAEDGLLARALPGFEARAGQRELALAVAQTFEDNALFVAESGTGTGKTFAYLVPALLSGKRVLISTGTRALQDQLYHRDLPQVAEALGVAVVPALLKGRSNYLCLHRLRTAQTELPGFETPSGSTGTAMQIERIRREAGRTRRGDIAEFAEIPEDAAVWRDVTSTAENCLGTDCDDYAQCHVVRARRDAQAAQVVVVNHHLLLADLTLKESGFGQLLPEFDAVILDEAHQLPELAPRFFGSRLSSRMLHELARDTLAEERAEVSAVAGLTEAAHALDQASAGLARALAAAGQAGGRARDRATESPRSVSGQRVWSEVTADAAVRASFTDLSEIAGRLAGRLELAAPRSAGFVQVARRAEQCVALLMVFGEGAEQRGHLRWVESGTLAGFVLNDTPLDVAGLLGPMLNDRRRAWLLTSATCSVAGDFSYFLSQMGIPDAGTQHWQSPFDYARQALLYLPSGLPDPRSPEFTSHMLDAILPVIDAAGGRTFLLFTSHRALKAAAQRLRTSLAYPLLVQGEAPRAELLARFRQLGNAVLLGAASFWEGVDVRGEALSCVIIDKLPFASPDDPVLRARLALIEEQGGNPFMDSQVPEAVIALKQGAGRLIRDTTDRGVLVLCDPRLTAKGYGRKFLDSLPPMPRTRSLDEVRHFFS